MGDHLGTPGAAGMGSDNLLRRIWMVSNPAFSTDGSGLWSCACDHIRYNVSKQYDQYHCEINHWLQIYYLPLVMFSQSY